MAHKKGFVPYNQYTKYSLNEMHSRARSFYEEMKRRRTVRDFSDKKVPREVIEYCIQAAGTAPNGVNMQPWHFVVVESGETKKEIREAAEKEEKNFMSSGHLKSGSMH